MKGMVIMKKTNNIANTIIRFEMATAGVFGAGVPIGHYDSLQSHETTASKKSALRKMANRLGSILVAL